MANKTLFKAIRGFLTPGAAARNEEGAPAYALEPRQALAQYAATGCLNATFYATDRTQRQTVLALCATVEPDFIARTAVFARERGFMKDMPALLCAVLSRRAPARLEAIFPRVIDNARMLRTFVQIVRSGATGRKSLGSLPKRLVRRWLAERSDEAIFRASVGQSPSLADVVRMVHPRPATMSREALYGWLLGRPYDPDALPELVRQYEAFSAGDEDAEVPDLPFPMLTQRGLGRREWALIAERASWQTTRMNLNTFARHGVLTEPLTTTIARRLRDRDEIRRARVFPYQLLAAYVTADAVVPPEVRRALEDAMELAIDNVPSFPGRVAVCPDVSGSMASPVTGARRGGTTAVRCIDVAALIAAAVLRRNPNAEVLPFEERVVDVRLNPRDTVMSNAAALAAIGGGGTSVSAPLARLNRRHAAVDVVIIVSDNQSWVDARGGRDTATMHEWSVLRRRNPAARLVCIDLQPYGTTQACERTDILNVGGFSDQVFDVIADFVAGRLAASHWIDVIESVEL